MTDVEIWVFTNSKEIEDFVQAIKLLNGHLLIELI